MEDMFTRTNGYFLSHAELIQANWTYLEVKLGAKINFIPVSKNETVCLFMCQKPKAMRQ